MKTKDEICGDGFLVKKGTDGNNLPYNDSCSKKGTGDSCCLSNTLPIDTNGSEKKPDEAKKDKKRKRRARK